MLCGPSPTGMVVTTVSLRRSITVTTSEKWLVV
jgi:hypothetical protein